VAAEPSHRQKSVVGGDQWLGQIEVMLEDGKLRLAEGGCGWAIGILPCERSDQQQTPRDYSEDGQSIGERVIRLKLPLFEGASSLEHLEEVLDDPT
jgi:hypothetical protein